MMTVASDRKNRCFGDGIGEEFYADYHDHEWGEPVHDDQRLFEMLILEGAQAGLSWKTILKRRQGYREAFYNFAIARVAAMSDQELEALSYNPNIIRHRLKIKAARTNARIALEIQREFGSLAVYLWSFVGHQTLFNYPLSLSAIPASSCHSEALSKDLKKRGMSFVGSVIIYAFMQAVGMIDDHVSSCWKSKGK